VGNIGSLIINDSVWGVVHQKKNHAFIVEDENIIWVGEESKAPACDARLDVEGGCVIPGFVDSQLIRYLQVQEKLSLPREWREKPIKPAA
jgi:N-acyl-D-aspartate/D-glutamate deacylase